MPFWRGYITFKGVFQECCCIPHGLSERLRVPVVNHKYQIVYFDVPKVASSTVKLAMYELEHGAPSPARNPEEAVHRLYPTDTRAVVEDLERYRDYWCFTVVRDPVFRLLSAYANRIGHHRDTYKGRFAHLRALLLGVPMDPDPDTFFTRLDRYRLQSGSIRAHVRPMARLLGGDLARFDRVYRIEEMNQLAADLAARTGRMLGFPRTQTAGKKLQLGDISDAAYAALRRDTQEDYAFLNGLYSPPDRTPSTEASVMSS